MRDRVWHDGEDAALEAYRRRGYHLLARNWRCPLGELDLVLTRGGVLVFCEVKARRSARLGEPWEAVTPAKQRKLRALAHAYLGATSRRDATCRFDVASGRLAGGEATVDVFEDAF